MKNRNLLIVFTIILAIIFVRYSIIPTYAVTVDTNPPELVSLSVDDENAVAGEEFTFNIVVEDDVSGVNRIELEFTNIAKENTKYYLYIYDYPNTTITLPDDMVSGKYVLSCVSLSDNNKNFINYQNDNYYSQYSKSLDSDEIVTINVINNNIIEEDSNSPVVSNIAFNTDKAQINDMIAVCADIEDESKLKEYYDTIQIYNIENGILIQFGSGFQKEGDGNRYCSYDKISKPGNYAVAEITVPDIFNNKALVYSRYGYLPDNHDFTISYIDYVPTITIEGIGDDEEPPILNSIKVNKKSLIAPGDLKIFVEAEDNSGDFLKIKVRLISEDKINKNDGFGEVDLFLDYDSSIDKYVGTAGFSQYVPTGKYYLQEVRLMDSNGNSSCYTTKKWESTGISISDPDFNYIKKEEVIEDLVFELIKEVEYSEVTSTTNSKLVDIIKSKDDDAIIMIDASNNYAVSEEVFEAIKGTNKTIYIEANGYQWVFNGMDIAEPKTINTYVYSELLVDDNINNQGQEYVAIVFADNGELPGKATIRVKTDYTFKYIEGVTNLKLYLYNPSEGKYYDTEETVELADDGFYEFDITHNSKYILSNKEIEEELLSENEEIAGKLIPSEKSISKKSDTIIDNKKNTYILYGIIAALLILIAIAITLINKNKGNPNNDIQV